MSITTTPKIHCFHSDNNTAVLIVVSGMHITYNTTGFQDKLTVPYLITFCSNRTTVYLLTASHCHAMHS